MAVEQAVEASEAAEAAKAAKASEDAEVLRRGKLLLRISKASRFLNLTLF